MRRSTNFQPFQAVQVKIPDYAHCCGGVWVGSKISARTLDATYYHRCNEDAPIRGLASRSHMRCRYMVAFPRVSAVTKKELAGISAISPEINYFTVDHFIDSGQDFSVTSRRYGLLMR